MNKLIKFVFACFLWPSIHGFRSPTLAPFDDDQEIMSKPQLAKHFETEFSISFRDPKCPESGATVLIHKLVHFWPGDRFEIPCSFCTRNFLSSGNPKIWRYMSLAKAFGWNKDAAGRRESWVR
uniref:Uncharacterized protein n=1 Tax=Romanomermis culicivorax TaxID=13658 RepID=A0A915HU91_ROMCU